MLTKKTRELRWGFLRGVALLVVLIDHIEDRITVTLINIDWI